jgi:hypothetical protein
MQASRTDKRTANLQASFGINKLLRISKNKLLLLFYKEIHTVKGYSVTLISCSNWHQMRKGRKARKRRIEMVENAEI